MENDILQVKILITALSHSGQFDARCSGLLNKNDRRQMDQRIHQQSPSDKTMEL